MRPDLPSALQSLVSPSVGTVVATDPVSANADYDNGTVALYGAPRSRRCDNGVTLRIVCG